MFGERRIAQGRSVGQGKRRGKRGETIEKRGVREIMRERGTKGRLRKACQGQFVGSSERRREYISLPMKFCNAQAPYDVKTA